MMRGLEGWHLVILVGLVAVLFGYKRMPEAARSLGRSMRILKSEVGTMRGDDEPADKPASVPSDPVTGPLRVDPTAHTAQTSAEILDGPRQ